MAEWQRISESINTLASFCGVRDIPELTRVELQKRYGFAQADVMVLFGGSIICGGDVLATAMRESIAKKYVIVGGEGHTTQALRDKAREAFPQIETVGQPEARVFNAYLQEKYRLAADYLECESTNCGNIITNLLALLERKRVFCRSAILCQDATMQRRMAAGLEKYAPNIEIIQYAAYSAQVIPTENGLAFSEKIPGMWELERYVSMLLGEIPRLTDSKTGYGPKGRGFIAHVDIPKKSSSGFHGIVTSFPTVYTGGK